jgi:hypothetical protein
VGVWGVRDETARRKPWLVPVRDAMHLAVWLASLVGNRIVWGGIAYAIDRGRMSPIASERSAGG